MLRELMPTDEVLWRCLVSGVLLGLLIAYAAFRTGFALGSRGRRVEYRVARCEMTVTHLVRNSSVWVDGEPLPPVGNIWIETAKRAPVTFGMPGSAH